MANRNRYGIKPPEGEVIQQTITTILSNPPPNTYKVTNIYVNPQNGKLVIEYQT